MDNYEKIILELLMRVQNLEKQVEQLKKGNQIQEKQIGTAEIKAYINSLKESTFLSGKEHLIVKANDIHKALNLHSRMPAVCTAMRQCMNLNDVVLHETPSGFSSTFEIKYTLK